MMGWTPLGGLLYALISVITALLSSAEATQKFQREIVAPAVVLLTVRRRLFVLNVTQEATRFLHLHLKLRSKALPVVVALAHAHLQLAILLFHFLQQRSNE